MSAGDIRIDGMYVELKLRDAQFHASMARASAKFKAFGDMVSDLGRRMAKFSALVAAPFVVSMRTFAKFEDQMAIVQAVTSATDRQFKSLTDRAEELGRTTSFTASEVASAMVALGRAGFNTNEILASIAGTLDLARAGAMDLGTATTIMTDVSRSFGIAAKDVGHVGDVLAKTANVANTDVRLVGESMKYVASASDLSGQSLERMSASLAILANRGLKGEMAGASLAMAMMQLSDMDMQDKLAGMGVAVQDSTGNMRDLVDILGDLNNALTETGNTDKMAVFRDLFDVRGMRSMLVLSQNMDQWKELTSVMEQSAGTAAVDGYMHAATGIATAVSTWIAANQDTVVSILKVFEIVVKLTAATYALGTAARGIGFFISAVSKVSAAYEAAKMAILIYSAAAASSIQTTYADALAKQAQTAAYAAAAGTVDAFAVSHRAATGTAEARCITPARCRRGQRRQSHGT